MTGPDRAYDADRLSTVGTAHEREPLCEGDPLGYVPVVLPPEGRPPPEAGGRPDRAGGLCPAVAACRRRPQRPRIHPSSLLAVQWRTGLSGALGGADQRPAPCAPRPAPPSAPGLVRASLSYS